LNFLKAVQGSFASITEFLESFGEAMGKWTMPVQGSFFLHTYITPTSGPVK